MPITRRHLAVAGAVTALAAGAGYWRFLRSPGAASNQTIDPAELAKASPLGDMALGLSNAPITIIEYASMTCPHCAEFHRTVFPELKAQYIDTGKVRFVFREFPIEVKATTCSMLARCIGKDDPKRFHAAVDALFAAQDEWMAKDTERELRRIGRQAGISDDGFNACMSDQRLLSGLQACRDHAYNKLKVEGTPTFFVNGVRLVGALPFEAFRNQIESNLNA